MRVFKSLLPIVSRVASNECSGYSTWLRGLPGDDACFRELAQMLSGESLELQVILTRARVQGLAELTVPIANTSKAEARVTSVAGC